VDNRNVVNITVVNITVVNITVANINVVNIIVVDINVVKWGAPATKHDQPHSRPGPEFPQGVGICYGPRDGHPRHWAPAPY